MEHLTKLKALVAENCNLRNINVNALESLEYLDVSGNQLAAVPRLRALQKLVNLDLSGNPLAVGFEEVETLRSLQVLDLGRCKLDVNLQQFYTYFLQPLKKLPKLTHLSFADNPMERTIPKFRLLVISELPKLKYLDWTVVTKEERVEAAKLEKTFWKDKTLPAQPLKAPVLIKAGSDKSIPTAALGQADKDLVNFLMGEDAATQTQEDPLESILKDLTAPTSGGQSRAKGNATAQLDDFFAEADAAGDPLKDIISFLDGSNKQGGTQAAGGDDFEDELMRAVYGNTSTGQKSNTSAAATSAKNSTNNNNNEEEEDDFLAMLGANLDAALSQTPQGPSPSSTGARPSPFVMTGEQQPAGRTLRAPAQSSVADKDLDELLDSIISIEKTKTSSPDVRSGKVNDELDALLRQEESERQRRLQEEQRRVAQERERLEKDRRAMEEEMQRSLEREKERLRLEMEAQKQREAQSSTTPAPKKMTLEEEALAMLDSLMEGETGASAAATSADAVLADIDALVSGGKDRNGATSASPGPTRPTPTTFGPRSTVAAAATGGGQASPSSSPGPARLPQGRLPIARRRADDDEVDALLASQTAAEKGTPTTQQGKPSWLFYWSQVGLGDRLGMGTLGITHVGWCRSSEMTVKKCKVQRFTDDFLSKFQADVSALMELQHPNIVRFCGVCIDDTISIMQGYVRGVPLWGYLHQQGNVVDLAFVAGVSRKIAAGMFYLHSKNVIHRTLHSKNVILDGEMSPKIRDYGMPFIKSQTYEAAMGPIASEAPELLRRSPFTNAVDAYSFGILLWELWTREDPYKGMSPILIKEQVLARGLRPEITPDIPTVFRRLMGACWNAEPEKRPTFLTIGKILAKPAEELGSYGQGGTAGPAVQPSGPVLQGPASKKAAPVVDLVATLQAPASVDRTEELLGKINNLLASSDKGQQLRGLRVAANLCEKKDYAEHLSDMKVLMPSIIRCMGAGAKDREVRDLAVQVCSKLALNGECAEAFLLSDGWATLLPLLQPSVDASLQFAASRCMTVLLKNPQNQAGLAAMANGVPTLIALLQSPNDTVQMNAVWAASLALEDQQVQDVFVRSGGVPFVLRLAQNQNPGVVLRVLVTVGLLLTNPAVFYDLKDSGVVPRFVRLVSSPSPLLQQNGMEALVRFSEILELREMLVRANGLQALLDLLTTSENLALKRLAVTVFTNFLDTEEDVQHLERVQALRQIVRLMVSNDAQLRLEALRFLSKAASTRLLRSAMQQMGALAPLVQLLNTKDKQLRMAALYTICTASEDEEASEAFVEADAVAQLVRVCLSSTNDPDVLALTTETFGNLSRFPAGVAAIRDAGGFPLLVNLLSPPLTTAVDGAISTLVNASSSEEGRITVAALDGLAPLLTFLNAPEPDRRERVLWSCPNWCQGATVDTVMSVALPALVKCLNDESESVQSLSLKTLLILASTPSHRSALKKARALESLRVLERTARQPTLKTAAAKARTLIET